MFQGSPNEVDPQPRPARLRPDRARRDPRHPRPPRPLRLPAGRRARGLPGPIYLTSATAELVELVLLDSGRLQEEFAKRHSRWERRHPDGGRRRPTTKTEADYRAARRRRRRQGRRRRATSRPRSSRDRRPADSDAAADRDRSRSADGRRHAGRPGSDAARPAAGARDRPRRSALHGGRRRGASCRSSATSATAAEVEVAPGIAATFLDAGHILGSAIIELRGPRDGRRRRRPRSSSPATSAGRTRRSSATRRR